MQYIFVILKAHDFCKGWPLWLVAEDTKKPSYATAFLTWTKAAVR